MISTLFYTPRRDCGKRCVAYQTSRNYTQGSVCAVNKGSLKEEK